MSKSRLEAFSDGVNAILITIMVLEFKIPQVGTIEALLPLIPIFLTYVLSFIFLGIYWNYHHHMLFATTRIDRQDGPLIVRGGLYDPANGNHPQRGPRLETKACSRPQSQGPGIDYDLYFGK